MTVPRVALVVIFLLTDWFSRAHDTVVWPVLGFVFMPFTTLAYTAAFAHTQDLTFGWLVAIIVGVAVDIGNWGGGYKARRRRIPRR